MTLNNRSNLRTFNMSFGWTITYAMVFVFSMWRNHESLVWNGANLSSSVEQMKELWGWSDPGSYINLGEALAERNSVPDDLLWIVVLWPIGMPTVYRLSIVLSEVGIPVLLGVQLMVGFVWFVALTSIRTIIGVCTGEQKVGTLTVTIFALSSVFRDKLIGQLAIYSDSITLAMLIVFCSFTILAMFDSILEVKFFRHTVFTKIRGLSLAVIGGISLAFASLTRAQYSHLKSLFGVAVVLLVAYGLFFAARREVSLLLRFLRHGGSREGFSSPPQRGLRSFVQLFNFLFQSLRARRAVTEMFRVISVILIVVGVSSAVETLYLNWRESRVGVIVWDSSGARALSNTSALAWRATWQRDEQLADFGALGGQGTACRIDQVTCTMLYEIESSSEDPFNEFTNTPLSSADYERYATELMRERPLDWLSDKLPYFIEYSTMELGVTRSDQRTAFDVAYRGLSAVSGLILISVFAKRSGRSLPVLLLGILWSAVLLMAVAPSFIAHFEVRYLAALFFTQEILHAFLLSVLLKSSLNRLTIVRSKN